MRRMLETRSHAWREVGLARQLSKKAVRRARVEVLVLIVLTAATAALYIYRQELFGIDAPIRFVAAAALLLLGFGISRPAHVGVAARAGAAGVISGSAIVQQIADNAPDGDAVIAAVTGYTRAMSAATDGARA